MMEGSSNLFDAGEALPPLSASEFKSSLFREYGGDTTEVEACIERAVEDYWPVGLTEEGVPVRREGEFSTLEPSFREHQKGAVVDIIKGLYVEDADAVTLSAPTGAGKSLILHGALQVVKGVAGRDGFFTTPLNALIDQVDNDDFIESDVITLKGMNNYDCVHPHDRGTSVDKAVCQRVSDFECEMKDKCEYYGRKAKAQSHPEVVTNMSYLMANSMIPEEVESKFVQREVLEVDECQKIEDFGIQFIGFTVSEQTIPVVYDDIPQPPRGEDIEELTEWLRVDVMSRVSAEVSRLEDKPELSENELDDKNRLEEFARKCRNFLNDVAEHHWVATRDNDWDGLRIEFKPIYIGRFLDRFLWSQGHKTILSSATIPKGDFLEEVGLDDAHVVEVEIPSTFPVERRPVIKDDVGKMTMAERDTTIPKVAARIAELADEYKGERGFIHCHSYKIAERLYERLPTHVKERTRLQDADDREASLDAWLEAPNQELGFGKNEGGQVFLSVAMDEGISLDGNDARWQVVAKAAYPFMGDKRVSYRLNELNDWNWYAGKAAINLQQAVGRGMRSKDDWCDTYILDTSAVTLIERNEHLFEDWFLDAVGQDPFGVSKFDVPTLD